MADIELDSLELQITSDAKNAQSGLDALIGTLDTLKLKTKGGVGLTAVANQVGRLALEAGKLNGSEGTKLESLARGLQALSGLGNLKLSSSIANQISGIGSAVKNLDGVDFSKVTDLATGLAPLGTIGKSNLGSVMNQLKTLPSVMAELNKVDMNAFTAKVKQLTTALKPLADEMQKVANGFSAFPAKIQKFLSSSSKVPSSNNASSKSFVGLAAKATAFVYTLKRAGGVVAQWINKSNEHVENLNLFTVSMGEYAASAQEYAESVGEVMGIDPSAWMRNQGVFMTLATGFGVATDRAATMSQQLTQLGYDISSFYNTSVEDAMQKLQSGLSGELEPLRRLGYDLSQAKLEATALSLGIDKTVSSMTQAEKAELRYYAIMTQVTQVQGDMARTLEAPANQMRIFKAQTEQAARALGNIFIPALNAILPYAIAAVKIIRMLADAVAALFGFELTEVGSSGISGLGDDAGGASKQLDQATGSAKKLRKVLLGIDELNVLPDTSAGAGSGSGEGAGGSFNFELPTYDFIGEATDNRVNEIVKKMREWLGIADGINSWSDILNSRLGSILSKVGLIGAGILAWKLTKGFIDGIAAIKALLASPSYSIAIGLILSIVGFTLAFDGMEDAIKNGLDGLNFTEIVSGSLFGTAGAAIVGSKFVAWLAKIFEGKAIGKAIASLMAKLGVKTAGALGATLLGAVSAIVTGLGAMFVGIYDAIKNGIDWLSGILISGGATAAGAGIGALIGSIGGPLGAAIGLAVGLLTDFGIWLWQNFEKVEAWFTELPGVVKVLGTTLVFVLTGGIVPIITGIITLFKKWDSVVEMFRNGCSAVGQFFVSLWNGIVSVWNTVAAWFNTNVIQPVVGFFSGLWSDIVAIFTAAPGWFNTNVIQPVVGFFVGMWNGISAAASKCWSAIVKFFSPAINWFSKLFGSIRQTISDIFYNIGIIASGCWEIIKAAWGIVSTWFNTKVIQPVKNFFTQLWATIRTTAINAWNGIKSVFSTIGGWINQKIIIPVRTFFSNLWNGVKTGAIAAWTGIKSAYASVPTWISTKIIQPVGKFFSNLWAGFINGAKNAWSGVKSVFSTVASFFKTTFQNAWNGIIRVFSTAGAIFVNIKNAIVTAFKSIVNRIISGLNTVIAIPFNGINTALSRIRSINILGLTPFSGLKTISVPAIPLLAQGGVVDSGQLFVANERGPELVSNIGHKSAVMNNDQIVDSVSKGVYRAVTQAMGQSGGSQVVEAKVNDKVLFEVVVDRNRRETMRTGLSPLLGGA